MNTLVGLGALSSFCVSTLAALVPKLVCHENYLNSFMFASACLHECHCYFDSFLFCLDMLAEQYEDHWVATYEYSNAWLLVLLYIIHYGKINSNYGVSSTVSY